MISFEGVGHQSKRKKLSHLIKNYTKEELAFATASSLRLSGQRDAAIMLENITKNSDATKLKHAITRPASVLVKYTPEEALALYINRKLTVQTYLEVRSGAKQRHADIYPSYDCVRKAKIACYPPKEFIHISDMSAEVHLQALVDTTVLRLAIVQLDVLMQEAASKDKLVIIYN